MGKKRRKNRGRGTSGDAPIRLVPAASTQADPGLNSASETLAHPEEAPAPPPEAAAALQAAEPAELILPRAKIDPEPAAEVIELPAAPAAAAAAQPEIPRYQRKRWRYGFYLLLSVGLMLGYEFYSSYWQSLLFSHLGEEVGFTLETGPNPEFPNFDGGPYDRRFGYSLLGQFLPRLTGQGFTIKEQARLSPRHQELLAYGAFPIYREKSQSGLTMYDMHGETISISRYPESVYRSFEEIPKLVADTLLYIEDRKLLDESRPRRNPTLDWERLVKATLDFAKSQINRAHQVPGGSTLATQTEKYRHSPQGITHSPSDKLRQMFSASLRAYSEGPYTIGARREILRDYLNSVPLAAIPGYGEVNGLADGLWAYYGRTLSDTNRLLAAGSSFKEPALLAEQGAAYRQVLSLFLAHRRPSELLRGDPEQLEEKVNTYLDLLSRDKVITEELYQAARDVQAVPRRVLPKVEEASFLGRKGQNLIRTYLLGLLGMDRLYELDRIDVRIDTTLHNTVQSNVSKQLVLLKDPKIAQSFGVEGFRMLSSSQDLGKLIYSFTLFESDGKTNKLRVQTDNFDQPFNINEGTKLDLGSTAKLRTLVTYLQVIEELYVKFFGKEAKALKEAKVTHTDPLSQWGLEYLIKNPETSLRPMLEAAMERKYSASPGEAFFTAGGLHTFENFNHEDNGRVVTVRQAIRNSINLPFIRLMRDIVFYYQLETTGSTARTLKSMEDMSRREYLARFADQEGKIFLKRFYDKYHGKTSKEILGVLLDGVEFKPRRFAAVYWVLTPEAKFDEFSEFMRASFEGRELTDEELQNFHKTYSSQPFTLGDRGYIARVHPLELWLAAYLYRKPEAGLSEVYEASAGERQEVYGWLFQSKRRAAQDTRIRTMIESEAFVEIHRRWKALGYPLDALVPSYATALGTSADRPSALAELMGIIVNGGRRLPTEKIERIEFAADTPFATNLNFEDGNGEQVLNAEIASLVKAALLDVVENGTAVRLKGGIKTKNGPMLVGGKTGTGDHRHEVYGPGGRVKESRVVNRTATFVFFIGDRFFGTITAFVKGNEAKNFKFTSSLPVQLVKSLGPTLEPLLIEGSAASDELYGMLPYPLPWPLRVGG